MDRSESIVKLAAAFVKAQATIESAKKDSVNPFFKSKYADLGEVWRVVKDAFTPHGLSVLQIPETDPEKHSVTLTTILLHESGEWLAGTMPVNVGKKTLKAKDGSETIIDADGPQDIGSALTYARRYALAGLCGVVAEPDDDGESAMGRGAGHAKAQALPAPAAAKPAPAAKPPKAPLDEITASIVKLQADLAKRFGISAAELKDMTSALRTKITDGRAQKLADLKGEEADQLSEALTQWATDQEQAPPDPDPFGDASQEALAEEAQ